MSLDEWYREELSAEEAELADQVEREVRAEQRAMRKRQSQNLEVALMVLSAIGILSAVLAALTAICWIARHSNDELERAKGRAEAVRDMEAVGGERAWVASNVNAWCVSNGKEASYVE